MVSRTIPELPTQWIGSFRRVGIAGIVDDMAKSRRSADATPDLFDASRKRAAPADVRRDAPPETSSLLPSDLYGALSKLSDADLKRLTDAVTAESERRNPISTKPTGEEQRFSAPHASKKTNPRSRVPKLEPVPLTPGRLNAIRAALGAGIKVSTVARQFGVSQAAIQKALKRDDAT